MVALASSSAASLPTAEPRRAQGFGWAIAKALAQAGCEIVLGTWVPALGIFEKSLQMGKFDKSRALSDGSLLSFAKARG